MRSVRTGSGSCCDARLASLRRRSFIDKYDSTSDMPAEMWLGVFEQATRGFEDEDRIELLMSYVTKDALRWYAQFVTPLASTLTWAQVRTRFIDKFSRIHTQPVVAAKNRSFQSRETVQTYFDEKSRLLELARLPQDAMVALLTDGMPDAFKTPTSTRRQWPARHLSVA